MESKISEPLKNKQNNEEEDEEFDEEEEEEEDDEEEIPIKKEDIQNNNSSQVIKGIYQSKNIQQEINSKSNFDNKEINSSKK